MVELIDNLVQLAVTMVCCVGAGILFSRSRRQPLFLLACFYGTFSLGTLYWTLHMALYGQTPPFFYVSELGWVAAYLFLLAIQFTMLPPEERKFHTPLALLVLLICVPQFILYITHGDVVINILMCGLTMLAGCVAVRGLVYAKRSGARGLKPLHIAVLVFVALEYALWTWSCFWVSDTMTNPYFWCDFLLSGALLALLPAVRKAAGA